jgi:hypothetical protein
MTVRAAHARASGVRRPIRPHVGADQSASATDHPRIQIEQRGIVRQPVGVEGGAVAAPGRDTEDQQRPATMRADVAHGDKFVGAAGRDHTAKSNSPSRRVKTDQGANFSAT